MDECTRILRASARGGGRYGILCHPVPTNGRVPSIKRLYDRAVERIAGSDAARNHPRLREAKSLLEAAWRYLSNSSRARHEANEMIRRGLQPVTRTMHCPIDAQALHEYVVGAGPEADEVPRHKDGRSYGATLRDLARALATRARTGSVDIRYHHSRLGAQLYLAGLVDGSREYAVKEDRGLDPFATMPKALRAIAMRKSGADFDDNASFARCGLAILPYGRDEVKRMLDRVDVREEILRKVGG